MLRYQSRVMAKRVLIIDDDEDIRVIAQASLMLIAALEVSVASSALEGFEKAIAEQPDAILLDVMMPGIDGITLVRQLQTHPATQQIPIVLLTAKTQAPDRQRFADLGVVATIAKPFKPAKLVAQFLKALDWE